MGGAGTVDDVGGVGGCITPLFSGVRVAGETGAVEEERIARVAVPDRVGDADGVRGMEGGIGPAGADVGAVFFVVVGLVGVAD